MAFNKLREYFNSRYEKITDDKYRCVALAIYYGYCLGVIIAVSLLTPNIAISVIRSLMGM